MPLWRTLPAMLSLCLLTACASVTGGPPVRVDGDLRWTLLPFENLSTTPRAGDQARALVESALRERGLRHLETPPASRPDALAELLDPAPRLAAARAQARRSGARYAVGGVVHEWHYRRAPDAEPAVGLSLRLIDLASGETLWQGSAARGGWGYASLSGTGARAVDALLDSLRIERAPAAEAGDGPSLGAATGR